MQYEIVEGQWVSEGRAIVAGPGTNSFEDAIRTKLRAGWRLWGGVHIATGSSGTNPSVWQAVVKGGTADHIDYKLMAVRPEPRPAWHKGSSETVTDILKGGWVPFGDPSCTTMNAWQAFVKVAAPRVPPPTPGLLSPASTNDSMMGNVSEFKSLGRGRRRTQRRR